MIDVQMEKNPIIQGLCYTFHPMHIAVHKMHDFMGVRQHYIVYLVMISDSDRI